MADKKYAGFGVRLVAALIDGVILSAAWAILRQVFFLSLPFFRHQTSNLSVLFNALYYILLWVNWGGQTIGKKAMKIKVIQENGQPLDYKEAVIRYLGYFVSGLVLGLGFLWVIGDAKKQGWHDKIAKTLVVNE